MNNNKIYVVYTDWRDRQFAPEIIGVFDDKRKAEIMAENIKRDLYEDGHDDDEVVVTIDEIYFNSSKSEMEKIYLSNALDLLQEVYQLDREQMIKFVVNEIGMSKEEYCEMYPENKTV